MSIVRAILALVLLLSGLNAAFADVTLSFLSINVWSGLHASGVWKSRTFETAEQRAFRYGILVNEIRKISPDIIAVNEANTLPGYARRLGRDLGYDYVYEVARAGVRLGPVGLPINLREGNVILAKKELHLRLVGSKRLLGGYAGNFASFQRKEADNIVAAAVTVGGNDLYLFTTRWHASVFADGTILTSLVDRYESGKLTGAALESAVSDAIHGAAVRKSEAQRSLDYINEVAGEIASVFMGSLNALPGSAEVKLLTDAGFVDCWSASRAPGYTWDERKNTNVSKYYPSGNGAPAAQHRVDYVLYRGAGLKVVSAKLALDTPVYDVYPSTHFGVFAEISFPTRQSSSSGK